MIFYSFYTDKYRDPATLVYRTEDAFSPLQINLKMFSSKKEAENDFFKILWDNEDFRIGEYFDTEKGKKKTKEKVASTMNPIVSVIPPDYKLELDKVYNLKWEVFMPTVPDKYIDYIFTSPPYNIKKQVGSEGGLYAVYEDDLTQEEYFDWLCHFIDEGMRVVKRHLFLNIQMLGKNKVTILGLLGKYKYLIKDIAIWEKTIVAPHIQPGIMNSAFEFIFIFSNDSPEKKVFSDANWSQGTFNNVIRGINASQNKYRHLNKATFPMYLPRIFMQNFGKKGCLWYDPFSGTGTTFHSAIIEEMHFLGTEIDTEQCEATNKRIWVEESALKLDFGDNSEVGSVETGNGDNKDCKDDAVPYLTQTEKIPVKLKPSELDFNQIQTLGSINKESQDGKVIIPVENNEIGIQQENELKDIMTEKYNFEKELNPPYEEKQKPPELFT